MAAKKSDAEPTAVETAEPRKKPKAAPARKKSGLAEVKLGDQASNGISAAMFGLIERGAHKRPRIAKAVRGTVELRFKEDFAPVRVTFGARVIVIEDVVEPPEEGTKRRRKRPNPADLVISGNLPDIVQLASAPLFGGVPKPTDARGRGALARLAGGRVRIEGNPLLARRLLKLLEI
jgi:hypothetical protein